MKRTVLITGSTSGIGKATAIAFAQLGYNIIFNGIESDGAAIAGEIAEGYKINYVFRNGHYVTPNLGSLFGLVSTGSFGV